ncbi:MAG: hypothetical protein ABEK04_04040, partial [Candidatus Nanohalobium sp.]
VKVNVIQASLDAIGLFLVLNLVTFLFSIQLVSGLGNPPILLGVSVVFFLGDLIYRVRNYRLEIYEEQNPELKEVLRTARDNLDKSDIASQALFDDLMERARSVTSESIIPSKFIIQRVLTLSRRMMEKIVGKVLEKLTSRTVQGSWELLRKSM